MRDVVVGIGNTLLQDDGIAPYVVTRLQREAPLPQVQYLVSNESGFRLVESLIDCQRVLLIDSIVSQPTDYGRVWCYQPSDFQRYAPATLHAVDIFAALDFFQQTNVAMPSIIRIIAIGIKANAAFAEGFTPEIEARREHIYQTVQQMVAEFMISKGGKTNE